MNPAPVTQPLLSVHDMSVSFQTKQGPLHALDRVSLDLQPSRTLAVVGESGSGKSVLSLSIMRLLTSAATTSRESRVQFDGLELSTLAEREMRKVRGRRIGIWPDRRRRSGSFVGNVAFW